LMLGRMLRWVLWLLAVRLASTFLVAQHHHLPQAAAWRSCESRHGRRRKGELSAIRRKLEEYEEEEEELPDPGPPPPVILTWEPVNTLIRRTVPLGVSYRDAALQYAGLMLPRPDVFQDAYWKAWAQMNAESPRFGAGGDSEEWWRKVAKLTYDQIIQDESFGYTERERRLFDERFELIFEELYQDTLVSDESWELVPRADRILDGMMRWKDSVREEGQQMVIGILSTKHDDRIVEVMDNLFGRDVIDATFDFIFGDSDVKNVWELGLEELDAMDVDKDEKWLHVLPDPCLDSHAQTDTPSSPPHVANSETLILANAKIDLPTESDVHTTLVDLVDLWGLPRIKDDDILETTYFRSSYDLDQFDE